MQKFFFSGKEAFINMEDHWTQGRHYNIHFNMY